MLQGPDVYPDLPKISDKLKGLNICALVADDTACAHYRIVAPLKYLKAYGANVKFMYRCFDMSKVMTSEFIILPRMFDPSTLGTVTYTQWLDKIYIYEIDDDLHRVSRRNPAYSVFNPKSHSLPTILDYLKLSSGVLVTTNHLKQVYSAYNQNIFILDNYLDLSLRDWGVNVNFAENKIGIDVLKLEKTDDTAPYFTIGYSGGTSHSEDIEVLGKQVAEFMKGKDDVRFVTCLPDPLVDQLVNQNDIPREKIIKRPTVHLKEHPKQLRGVDVQLAPLATTQFNCSKCVVGHTRVYTDKGAFKIRDLQPESQEVDTFTPLSIKVHTQNGLAETRYFYYAGEVPTKVITTSNGYVVEGSLTHRVKDDSNNWVYLSEIKTRDKLRLAGPIFPTKYFMVDKANEVFLEKSLAFVAGLLIGDGHYRSNGLVTIYMNSKQQDLAAKLVDILIGFNLQPEVSSVTSNRLRVQIHSDFLAGLFKQLGIRPAKHHKDYQPQIPEAIWQSPKGVVASFLSAIIEQRGTFSTSGVTVTLREVDWSAYQFGVDFHELLLGFSILAHKSKTTFRFRPSLTSCVDLQFVDSQHSKNFKMSAIPDPILIDRVTMIGAGKSHVYDLEVPKEEHWLGGCFVQHNSALKIKESMLAGCAVIASAVGPYAEFHYSSGGKFQIVGESKRAHSTWKEALDYYYNNPEKLEKDQVEGRNYIATEHSLEKHFIKWAESLIGVKANIRKGIAGPPIKKPKGSPFGSIHPTKGKCPITGKKYKDGYYKAFG